MKQLIFLTLSLSATLFAYTDGDMDGVDDAKDRCPYTPFNDLVDENGCTVKSLIEEHHFDIILGAGYSQLNYASNAKDDTLTTTVQADYFNKNISAQVVASYYASSHDDGANDTLIAGYYQIPLDDHLSVKMGAGILLPTYDTGYNNEAADYMGTVCLTYLLDSQFAFLGGYSYTFVNDKNVPGVFSYQDIHAYFAGVTYLMDSKRSIGVAYSGSDSIYRDVETIEKVSAYGMYRFDTHWFANLNYSYGLSDSASDHALDLRIGYSF